MTEYEVVIGLETHIQLNTKTKIFCACKADSWEDEPNTNICPVCTGLPGVLPVLNKAVVEKGVLLAKSMHSDIRMRSFFDRKNYFYPDLPKGYQISQYDLSLASGGYLDIPMPEGYTRRVTIHKLHMEEDAGKTKNAGKLRLIDFNRCGVPLVEMVTGPDLRSANEAAQYLIRLRQLLRWLGISEADMEKGHLRCDANVSIRPKGSDQLFTKTEIKNVNSIDNVKNAIEHEVERQIREVEAGNRVHAWTLDWDDETGTMKMMRSKETEADYRYFREPDLLPLVLVEGWVKGLIAGLPELPLARRDRFMADYGLPHYDADILTGERALSDYYEETVRQYDGDPKVVSNWMMNEVLRMLNDLGVLVDELKLRPAHLAGIMRMIDEIRLWAFRVVMAGNIKGFLDRHATAAGLAEEARIRNLNPVQCCAYTDGTKLGVEMALVSNATGLVPWVPGMEGPRARDVHEVFTKFDFDRYGEQGVVDYILGAEPGGGVFVVGHCDDPLQREYLQYYKMGMGPYYLFYRPYHLCHLETTRAIALAALYRRAVLVPEHGRVADVYAHAKRDVAAGETVEHGMGGDQFYGLIAECALAEREGWVPLALLEPGLDRRAVVTRALRRDQPLAADDVELPRTAVVRLFEEQARILPSRS